MITEAFLEAFWGILETAIKLIVPLVAIKFGFGILLDNLGIKK